MFVSSNEKPRRCSRCRELKPASEFAWHRKALGRRQAYCRPCHAAYKRTHYAANKQRYIDLSNRRKDALLAERVAFLFEYFRTHPCADCGESDPIVLEFDHLGEKNFAIAYGIRTRTWRAVLDEIAKCDVVCPNCHRRRTVRRGGFARAVAAQAADARRLGEDFDYARA
jgi:hypothetical protein